MEDEKYYLTGEHKLLEVRRIPKENGECDYEIAQLYSDEILPKPDDTTEQRFNITSKVSMKFTSWEFMLVLRTGYDFVKEEMSKKED